MPQGLAMDAERIYIVDSYYDIIAVSEKPVCAAPTVCTKQFFPEIGEFGGALGKFKDPMDAVMDKEGKLFVANKLNHRIEVFGIDSFSGIEIAPKELNVSVTTNGSSVSAQVAVSSINASPAAWTAEVPADISAWLSVSATSGTTPSNVEVTVNPSGLSGGKYEWSVVFKSAAGMESVLVVNVTAEEPAFTMSVSPSSLEFVHKKNAEEAPSGTLLVNSVPDGLGWTAETAEDWIGLGDTKDKKTPGSAVVSLVAGELNNLSEGVHTGSVRIEAIGGAEGSPADIGVSVEVVLAGTLSVTTNLEGAEIAVAGPGGYSYKGEAPFSDDMAPEGDYTVTYEEIKGYKSPAQETKHLESAGELEFSGKYFKGESVITSRAGGREYRGNTVRVYEGSGIKLNELKVMDWARGGVDTTTGDIDGDGVNELIAGGLRSPYIGVIDEGSGQELLRKRVFSYSGLKVAGGDLDGDGDTEVVAWQSTNSLKVLDYADGQLQEVGSFKAYSGERRGSVLAGAGDMDGDGIAEVITAAYGVKTTTTTVTTTTEESPYRSWWDDRYGEDDDDDEGSWWYQSSSSRESTRTETQQVYGLIVKIWQVTKDKENIRRLTLREGHLI
jgi:hypothetical protein